jgi:hypothetical protein
LRLRKCSRFLGLLGSVVVPVPAATRDSAEPIPQYMEMSD